MPDNFSPYPTDFCNPPVKPNKQDLFIPSLNPVVRTTEIIPQAQTINSSTSTQRSTISPRSPSTLPTSPSSKSTSPNDNDRVKKRTLNTLAARRYRQKRLDQVSTLEQALKESEAEKEALKTRVARLEGEVEVLRALMKKDS